uniref:Uncharacterized protein n=1 Tax=Meloidogyne floridensis TaxID=298350 RepID=A0A915PF25_9BILA
MENKKCILFNLFFILISIYSSNIFVNAKNKKINNQNNHLHHQLKPPPRHANLLIEDHLKGGKGPYKGLLKNIRDGHPDRALPELLNLATFHDTEINALIDRMGDAEASIHLLTVNQERGGGGGQFDNQQDLTDIYNEVENIKQQVEDTTNRVEILESNSGDINNNVSTDKIEQLEEKFENLSQTMQDQEQKTLQIEEDLRRMDEGNNNNSFPSTSQNENRGDLSAQINKLERKINKIENSMGNIGQTRNGDRDFNTKIEKNMREINELKSQIRNLGNKIGNNNQNNHRGPNNNENGNRKIEMLENNLKTQNQKIEEIGREMRQEMRKGKQQLPPQNNLNESTKQINLIKEEIKKENNTNQNKFKKLEKDLLEIQKLIENKEKMKNNELILNDGNNKRKMVEIEKIIYSTKNGLDYLTNEQKNIEYKIEEFDKQKNELFRELTEHKEFINDFPRNACSANKNETEQIERKMIEQRELIDKLLETKINEIHEKIDLINNKIEENKEFLELEQNKKNWNLKNSETLEERFNKFEKEFIETFGWNMKNYKEMEEKIKMMENNENEYLQKIEIIEQKFNRLGNLEEKIRNLEIFENNFKRLQPTIENLVFNDKIKNIEILEEKMKKLERLEDKKLPEIEKEIINLNKQRKQDILKINEIDKLKNLITNMQEESKNNNKNLNEEIKKLNSLRLQIGKFDFTKLEKDIQTLNENKRTITKIENEIKKFGDLDVKIIKIENLEREMVKIDYKGRLEKLEKNITNSCKYKPDTKAKNGNNQQNEIITNITPMQWEGINKQLKLLELDIKKFDGLEKQNEIITNITPMQWEGINKQLKLLELDIKKFDGLEKVA